VMAGRFRLPNKLKEPLDSHPLRIVEVARRAFLGGAGGAWPGL
jgi:hypothetical protein